jgi:dihydroorotate dehydrogenase
MIVCLKNISAFFSLLTQRYTANAPEQGGLSGPPLLPLSLRALRTLRSLLPADIPLIGCGGISSGADALEFARAGASAVQMYTAFGYGGVGTPGRVKDEVVKLLKAEGKTWKGVVKEGVEKWARKESMEKAKEGRPKLTFEEGGIRDLIKQAEEISRRLDVVGRKVLVERVNVGLGDKS